MSSTIGSSPLRNLDFEGLIRPSYEDKSGLAAIVADDEKVRRLNPDSVDIDGRTVDAGQTAKNNFKAIGKTIAKAIPTETARGLINGLKSGSLPRVVTNAVEGLAIDVYNFAQAPLAVAKDGLEAVTWSVVAGVEHLTGKDIIKAPKAPAGPPPEIDAVNLRTKETGRSGYFQYALKDGQIWTKYDPILPDKAFEFKLGENLTPEQAEKMLADGSGPYDYSWNAETNSVVCAPKADADELGYKMVGGRLQETSRAEASQWHLHDTNGGPHLPEGEKIVAIQVAGDFVEALSDNGKMYRYDPTKKDCAWKEDVGCPFHYDVNMPDGVRDWTLGEGTTIKPKRNCLKSMNPYTDIVGHFEDVRGRRGDFNFVATTGILTGNGREIRYRDTGLAADFSRGFLTPHKGQFEADKLTQAGSTWFISGTEPDGTPAMYTRMYDYEINGACPGQSYTYDDSKSFESGKNYPFADNVAFLPLPGWSKVEFPELAGEAKITDHIDIVPTGQGNSARELRIAGADAKGVTGFYHKGIDEKEWQFTATKEPLTGKTIEPGKVDPQRVSAETFTVNYDEAQWGKELKDAPLANIELNDFNQFQTPGEPSQLVFVLESGQRVAVDLHTVDGYTFYNQRPEDANVVGKGAGVPKVLTGSLVIPDEVKNSQDPEVKAFVDKYLLPLDRKENQLMLQAENDSVRLTSGWFHRNSEQSFDWTANPDYDITIKRDAAGESTYEMSAAAAHLKPTALMDRDALKDVIMRNESLQQEMTKEMKHRKTEHKLLWARAQITEVAMRGLSFGICALNLSALVNHGAAVSQLMPPLMDAHEKAHFSTAFKTPAGYARAQEMLEKNIAAAQAMLDKAAAE